MSEARPVEPQVTVRIARAGGCVDEGCVCLGDVRAAFKACRWARARRVGAPVRAAREKRKEVLASVETFEKEGYVTASEAKRIHKRIERTRTNTT